MNARELSTRVRERVRAYTIKDWIRIASVSFVIALVLLWHAFISAPGNFPVNSFVVIEEDKPLSRIGDDLYATHVIRSPFLFSAWARVTGADRSVHAGRYLFSRPVSLFEVSRRIKEGETGVESVRVTLTEGMTAREMGDVLHDSLPDFDTDAFLAAALPYEGYLFPDTYFIEPGTSVDDIVLRLRATFTERTTELQTELCSLTLEEAVIMASLIEKEAKTPEDRRLVSGILWNRINKDMPLQVDAVFGYIRGVSGYVPTGDDPELDSPYNTYRVRGLPPGPIANPGLDALTAAVHPTKTSHLYYLTGRDGKMYYARTFDEHKRNREQYLD